MFCFTVSYLVVCRAPSTLRLDHETGWTAESRGRPTCHPPRRLPSLDSQGPNRKAQARLALHRRDGRVDLEGVLQHLPRRLHEPRHPTLQARVLRGLSQRLALPLHGRIAREEEVSGLPVRPPADEGDVRSAQVLQGGPRQGGGVRGVVAVRREAEGVRSGSRILPGALGRGGALAAKRRRRRPGRRSRRDAHARRHGRDEGGEHRKGPRLDGTPA